MADYSYILKTELDDLKQRIINNHIRAGQKASGRTIAAFEVQVSQYDGVLLGRKAIGTLETGRKGGKVPKGFYSIILRWVEAKGINVENPKTFAYFVAQKIAREGTKLYRDGGRSDIYSQEITRTLESVKKKVGTEMIKEFETIVLNSKVKENVY